MVEEMKKHEAWMKDQLHHPVDKTLSEFHENKIRQFQHERLVHLLVMLSVGIAFLLSIFATIAFNHPFLYVVDVLLCTLFIPYLFYYRNLENSIQKLYTLSDQLYASHT